MTQSAQQRRLRSLVDSLEPKLRREVQQALDRLADAVSIDVLTRALEQRDTVALERLLRSLPAELAPAVGIVRRAFDLGITSGASTLGIKASLALQHPSAAAAARASAADLVTNVTAETRAAMREIVARAFEEGLPPRQAAQLIKPLIGLNRMQARAVLNLRAALTARGVASEIAAARLERYAAKLLRQRSILIARTEIIRASTDGQVHLWQQAQGQGLLPQAAQMKWLVTPDDRLCPRCQQLSGATAPVGGVFRQGGSTVAGPPLHPNCRCALVIDVQSIAVSRRRAA